MPDFDTEFFREKLVASGKSQADLSRALKMALLYLTYPS